MRVAITSASKQITTLSGKMLRLTNVYCNMFVNISLDASAPTTTAHTSTNTNGIIG